MKTPVTRFLTMLGFCGLAVRVWAADTTLDAKEVFDRRIMPIFRSPNPSSGTECHLAGVDLRNYISPSHEKTFVSLRYETIRHKTCPQHFSE